jgi:hypothetical protein
MSTVHSPGSHVFLTEFFAFALRPSRLCGKSLRPLPNRLLGNRHQNTLQQYAMLKTFFSCPKGIAAMMNLHCCIFFAAQLPL